MLLEFYDDCDQSESIDAVMRVDGELVLVYLVGREYDRHGNLKIFRMLKVLH